MPKRPPAFAPRTPIGTDSRLSSRARGYSSRWDRESRTWRHYHPLCGYCLVGAFDEPRSEAATRVDHLYPQRRFPGVFWLTLYWVSSCDACDAAKQSLENGPLEGLDALALKLGKPPLGRGGSQNL